MHLNFKINLKMGKDTNKKPEEQLKKKQKEEDNHILGSCWCPFFALSLLYISGTFCEELLFYKQPP